MSNRYVVIFICSCLIANSLVCFRFARAARLVDSYRSDVEALSSQVWAYTTNVESRISSFSISSDSSFQFPASPSTNFVSSIPYRYCVNKGVPGLTSGGLSWYPVGSLMPYGILSMCDHDFAFFSDGSCYSLSHNL